MTFEGLQLEYLTLLGTAKLLSLADPSPDSEDANAFLQYMEQSRCRYILSNKFERCGLPTNPNEHMNFSDLLNSSMGEALFRADECGLGNFNTDVVVGLSPYSDFGAEVMRVDNGHLVLVSPITMSFCFVYAILAISSMQSIAQLPPDILEETRHGKFRSLYSDSRAADALTSLQALKSMIEEFAVTGTLKDPAGLVRSSGFGKLNPIYYERVQATYEHFITFLVLHEFAHIDLGHLDAKNKVMRSIPLGDKEYEVLDPLPLQEEEADDYALKALVGTNFREELMPLFAILQEGDTNRKELNKLWSGHTAYGRYASAVILMKGFDLMDSCHLNDENSGIEFTDSCEINRSHPSGQHRFIRYLTKVGDFIPLSEEISVNLTSILNWSNLITIVCRR